MPSSPDPLALFRPLTFALVAAAAGPALAQQPHHQGGSPQSVAPEHPGHGAPPGGASPHPPRGHAAQTGVTLLGLEAARNVSGTAWQPPATPHAAVHARVAGWDLMGHGLFFGGYDWQRSRRGAHAPVVVGWLMGMADRPVGAGRLGARLMVSPEFLTVQDGGYPLLLQTGETYQDQPLRDRQHPHDLLMEAALLYTHALTPAWALQLYVAPAGEPALGPPAFPHRQSAIADPLAPLGHHWQDATHISFGVVTAGIVTRYVKLEGSWFNGREPDETRYDLELRAPDSYAARLSANPTPGRIVQLSYAYLASPERLHPDEHAHRVTASTSLHYPLRGDGHTAVTAVWGINKEGHDPRTNAFLVESTLDLDGANVFFGRAEVVEKAGHDLVLPGLEDETFRISSLVLGYLRNVAPVGPILPGVGVRAAVNFLPRRLEQAYGTRTPTGGMVYLRLGLAPMSGGR